MADAMAKHPDADNFISFASLRSAYESTLEAISFPQVSTHSLLTLYPIYLMYLPLHR